VGCPLCSLGIVLLFTQTGQGAATTDPFTFFPNIVLTGNCVVGGVDLAPGSGGEALSPRTIPMATTTAAATTTVAATVRQALGDEASESAQIKYLPCGQPVSHVVRKLVYDLRLKNIPRSHTVGKSRCEADN
jgi:hypothetical protein